jgi:hypothetical protein
MVPWNTAVAVVSRDTQFRKSTWNGNGIERTKLSRWAEIWFFLLNIFPNAISGPACGRNAG